MSGQSPLDQYIDDLEAGKYDEPGLDPSVVDDTDDDKVDESEFTVEDDQPTTPEQLPQVPAGTNTYTQPNQVDPFEAQKQFYIEQGQRMAYENLIKGSQTQSQPPQVEEPDYVYKPEDVTLTEEELQSVERSKPIVEKLVKAQINQVYRDVVMPLQKQLREQQNTTAQTQESIRQERAVAFHHLLHKEIPDLAQLNATQEFWDYLRKTAPRSGGAWTNEQELTVAIQRGNLNAVKEIVGGYRPTPQPGVQNIAPGRPQAAVPPTTGKGSKKLAYSKLVKAQEDHSHGLITTAKLNRIMELYQEAEFAGNVDYNS